MFRSPLLKGPRAFTLIELLVVVAIIALLIAVLLPTLSRARAASARSACLANQRSMGQAMRMYAGEFDNVVPRDGLGGWGAFFAPHLSTYMGGPTPDWNFLIAPPWGPPGSTADANYAYDFLKKSKIFKCPSAATIDSSYVLTYVVNSLDFFKWNNKRQESELDAGLGFQKADLCENPASTAYTVEINMTTIAPTALGQYNVWKGWRNQPTSPGDTDLPFSPATGAALTTNRMIAGNDARRHLGFTTISYFDGHAEAVLLQKENFPPSLIRGSN